jgi:RND superfamily putative drug exporter
VSRVTALLSRLGRWCAAHGWRVVVVWVLVLLAIGGLNRAIGGKAAETYRLPGTDAAVAQDLISRAFPGSATEANPLVITSDLDLGSGRGAELVADVVEAERGIDRVTSAVGPADNPLLLSDDGRTAIVQVTVADRFAGDAKVAREVLDTAIEVVGTEGEVALGGFLGRSLSRPDTRASEAIGLAMALLVLFVTLRRFSAVLIPIVNAVIAVGVGLALVGLLGKVVFIPDVATTLGTMLGLGVGIDYALFLVVRHRLLLRRGFDVNESVARTLGTAGAAMVFAGGTLIAAVSGLVLTGLSFLAWLGIAAGIVVAVAVLASMTLVPAMLGIARARVRPKKESAEVDDAALDTSGWARLADVVTSRPWLFAVVSTVVLLVMAAPTVTLSLGHSDASILPETTTARQADDAVRAGFGDGESSPLAVVSQMFAPAEAPSDPAPGGDPRAQDPRLVELRETLEDVPGVVRADAPVVSTDGGVATIRVIPEWGSADPRTEALVLELRDEVLPAADAGKGMDSHVGGITSINIDLADLIAQRTPWFILGVVSMSFLLLMLAYRSLLIPLKAAAMNLLSIAAAYGVVTAIFQWGWGASLIGLDGPVPIDSYVPMMIFAVLFGLSMDYEVFLLTAFREQWERTGDMKVAVRRGLADTGKVVTAAALIMVSVFASFILSSDPTVKIFGVGLATAVAVDATIVRCLLVPSIMVLAAKGTWWLPRWLDRLLPDVHIEGDPAAFELDRVHEPDRSARPLARTSARRAWGAVAGVAVGAASVGLLAGRAAAVPVVVSAVLGAAVALLPAAATGGRAGLGRRLLGLAIGVLLAVGAASVVGGLVPPASTLTNAATVSAVVLVALLAVLALPRWIAVPAVLGAVSVAVTLLALQTSVAVALLVALVPALLAALVTEAAAGTGTRADTATSDVPDSAPSPADPLDAPPDDPARVEGEPVDAWPFGRDGGS